MARALWSGAIRFGLVNVPVKLFRATAASSGHGLSFHQLHGVCGTRIQHLRHCPHCRREVPWEEVVKGYEYAKGRYAVLGDKELAGLPREDKAAIAISEFVPAAEVDPLLFDTAYWMAPDGAAHPYGLLHRTLADSGRVGVARLMLRTRGHLAIVRPDADHLVLETLFYADEVVGAGEVPGAPPGPVAPRELELARTLVDAMTARFDHASYRDTYGAALRELVDQKIEGQEVVAPPEELPGAGDVLDLMEVLRRSVEAARAGHPGGEAASPAAAPARAQDRPTTPRPPTSGATERAAAKPRRPSTSRRPRKAG